MTALRKPFSRETISETCLYADDFQTIRLRIAAGITIRVTSIYKTKEQIFGKTPGGWALLVEENKRDYIKIPCCPICFDRADLAEGIDERSPTFFSLKCCDTFVHTECLEKMIEAGWSGKMISFNHTKCCNCRSSLLDLLGEQCFPGKIYSLLEEQKSLREAIRRLEEARDLALPKKERGNWAFFKCNKCKHPFCAGKISCAEEFELDPSKLICDGCQWALESKDHRCFKHGKDYAIFKCDFCCNVASWACWSHHYCNYCHDHGGYKHPTPCPGGKCCPLGIPHPPPIQKNDINKYVLSFVIGCRKCADPNAEIEYRSENLNPFDLKNIEADSRKDNMVQLFDYTTNKKKKRDTSLEDFDLGGSFLFDLDEDEESDSYSLDLDAHPEDIDLGGYFLFNLDADEENDSAHEEVKPGVLKEEIFFPALEEPHVMIPAQSS